jgi:hypothetical protein
VLRFSPWGTVEKADHIRLSFSKPMVPLGAQWVEPDDVPVRVDPATPGTWR